MLLVPVPHVENHCLVICAFLIGLCPGSLPSKSILTKLRAFLSLASLLLRTQTLLLNPGSRLKVQLLPSYLQSSNIAYFWVW